MQDRTNLTSLPPQIQIISITFVSIDNVVESKLPAHSKHMFQSPKKDIHTNCHSRVRKHNGEIFTFRYSRSSGQVIRRDVGRDCGKALREVCYSINWRNCKLDVIGARPPSEWFRLTNANTAKRIQEKVPNDHSPIIAFVQTPSAVEIELLRILTYDRNSLDIFRQWETTYCGTRCGS